MHACTVYLHLALNNFLYAVKTLYRHCIKIDRREKNNSFSLLKMITIKIVTPSANTKSPIARRG